MCRARPVLRPGAPTRGGHAIETPGPTSPRPLSTRRDLLDPTLRRGPAAGRVSPLTDWAIEGPVARPNLAPVVKVPGGMPPVAACGPIGSSASPPASARAPTSRSKSCGSRQGRWRRRVSSDIGWCSVTELCGRPAAWAATAVAARSAWPGRASAAASTAFARNASGSMATASRRSETASAKRSSPNSAKPRRSGYSGG